MISFVYFDVGGVVIRDFSGTNKWEEIKRDMGITRKYSLAFEQLWKNHCKEACTNLDVDLLIPLINKECHTQLPAGYSLLLDFVNRFEKNPSVWPVIENVRQKCRVGLLTNMYPGMFDLIVKNKLLPPTKWDVIIDSSKVGHAKPERKIFEIAEKTAGVSGKAVLFIDNTQKIVDAASAFGWQTFWYDSGNPEKSSKKLSETYAKIIYS